jgi:hypothetical protein
MKKLLLLLLFIPLVSFGQNDFRKMFFGESKEVLKEKYPDVEFVSEKEGVIEALTHFDNVLGLPASVTYMFQDNKLMGGAYMFNSTVYRSGDNKLKDFNSVSERLNDKYEMERDDTWYKDTWKDRPNSLGYAIGMGDVKLSEAGKKGDNIAIGHSVDDENHVLGFLLIDGFEAFEKSMDDDI